MKNNKKIIAVNNKLIIAMKSVCNSLTSKVYSILFNNNELDCHQLSSADIVITYHSSNCLRSVILYSTIADVGVKIPSTTVSNSNLNYFIFYN